MMITRIMMVRMVSWSMIIIMSLMSVIISSIMILVSETKENKNIQNIRGIKPGSGLLIVKRRTLRRNCGVPLL